ncbi:MAG: hypothetical protein C5B46_04700 [Proteobacteria bacterium]|nr:MAG: hypothetical protein C5B46_04700 [Pseudomonadota bacterium]
MASRYSLRHESPGPRRPYAWTAGRTAKAARWLLAGAAMMASVLQAADPPQTRVDIALTPTEKAWLAKHGTIRVGAETNYPPYEFQDSNGRFTGVVADYLEAIKHKLGVRFQVYQLLDFAAVEDKLRKRELDLILALAPSAEREQYLVFTKPYLHYVNVIVTRDDYGFVAGLKDFKENRVAVVEGHSSKQLTARVYPNYNVSAYPDLLEGLIAVSTGRVDGLVDDIFPIVYTIRQRRINNLKIATAVEKALQPQGFAAGVRSDWPELAGILDKVLDAVAQQEQPEISQKWLSVRYENKVDYRAIWTSVVVFSLILAVAVLWIRQLSRQRLALVAARADAEAANRAKDEFLANMSHELRTPLHAILGYTELVRGGALNETSRKEALSTIAHSGRHLLSLINDLLDLSRIKSGHLELNTAPVQLPALVEEIAAMVRVEAQSKGLDFFLDALANLPELVMADGRRLRQILLNLLGNAIKFTDVGGVTLTVSARVLDDQRAELRFSVQDTGVGIPTPDRSRIFAPFEQAEEGEKRESGAGLGLAISRELANLMGGDIEVESQPGVGSVFRFWVVVPVVSEPQAVVPVHERILGYRGGRRCILVVDDQEENRLLLQGMLQPVGFDVVLAAGGPEAVEAARTRRPDLVVMDLRMPKLSGFDAAAAIRRSPGLEHVVIVAASASSADLERAESERTIFATCLRKPFLAADLLETIERLLGLTWRYATQEGAVGAAGGWTAEDGEEHAPDAELLAPPRALLEELLGLARLGMLVRVEQIALDLAQRDERYRAFGRRVYGLARGFDEERLIALLEASLRAQSDAVTD